MSFCQTTGSTPVGKLACAVGATFLAVASALPEISSGIAAVRLGDLQLAVGDILGGNSFQICLFVLADALAGTPVIVAAHKSDVWLGGMNTSIRGRRRHDVLGHRLQGVPNYADGSVGR